MPIVKENRTEANAAYEPPTPTLRTMCSTGMTGLKRGPLFGKRRRGNGGKMLCVCLQHQLYSYSPGDEALGIYRAATLAARHGESVRRIGLGVY